MASEQERLGRPRREEIERLNPKVDTARLREAEAAMRELRSRGVAPPTSSIRSPYGQRLVRWSGDDDLTS